MTSIKKITVSAVAISAFALLASTQAFGFTSDPRDNGNWYACATDGYVGTIGYFTSQFLYIGSTYDYDPQYGSGYADGEAAYAAGKALAWSIPSEFECMFDASNGYSDLSGSY